MQAKAGKSRQKQAKAGKSRQRAADEPGGQMGKAPVGGCAGRPNADGRAPPCASMGKKPQAQRASSANSAPRMSSNSFTGVQGSTLVGRPMEMS